MIPKYFTESNTVTTNRIKYSVSYVSLVAIATLCVTLNQLVNEFSTVERDQQSRTTYRAIYRDRQDFLVHVPIAYEDSECIEGSFSKEWRRHNTFFRVDNEKLIVNASLTTCTRDDKSTYCGSELNLDTEVMTKSCFSTPYACPPKHLCWYSRQTMSNYQDEAAVLFLQDQAFRRTLMAGAILIICTGSYFFGMVVLTTSASGTESSKESNTQTNI